MGAGASSTYSTVCRLYDGYEFDLEDRESSVIRRGRRTMLYMKRLSGDLMDVRAVLNRGEKNRELHSELVENISDRSFTEFYSLFNEQKNTLLIDLLKRAMDVEEHEQFSAIQKEGINPQKMYIIEKGNAYSSVNKRCVRRLKCPMTYLEWLDQGGQAVSGIDCGPWGEIELLFDPAPSPNIRCTSDKCTTWSLTRTDYHKMVSVVQLGIEIQRARWLSLIPEVRKLGAYQRQRLVENLTVENYKRGDMILSRNRLMSRFLMIEKGNAMLQLPPEIIGRLKVLSEPELHRALGIIRPEGPERRCVQDMIPEMFQRFMSFFFDPDAPGSQSQSVSRSVSHDGLGAGDGKEEKEEDAGRGTGGSGGSGEVMGLERALNRPAPDESLTVDPYKPPPPKNCIEVGGGCIIGIDALRSKIRAAQIDYWNWVPAHYTDEMYLEQTEEGGRSYAGTQLPFNLEALGDVQIVSFSVSILDGLFGSSDDVGRGTVPPLPQNEDLSQLQLSAPASARSPRAPPSSFLPPPAAPTAPTAAAAAVKDLATAAAEGKEEKKESGEEKDEKKDEEKEEEKGMNYSSRQFGTISLMDDARVKQFGPGEEHLFQREVRILNHMKRIAHESMTPFFPVMCQLPRLGLSGLTIATERCARGDLWRLIHQPPPGIPKTTEDALLANFFYVQILTALDRMHSKGLYWRGVCPENIGIDRAGNAQLLDVGTAGYCKSGVDMTSVLNAQGMDMSIRTSTLCGTPEYMAPELVCGTTHDGRAVDLWAMGVLLHELYFGVTPFFGETDIHIFQNILKASKGKSGGGGGIGVDEGGAERASIHSIDEGIHTVKGNAASVVYKLLKSKPANRTGFLSNKSTQIIEETNLFDSLELDLLEKGRLKPLHDIPFVY